MNTYLIGEHASDSSTIIPWAILQRPAGMPTKDFEALVQIVTEALPDATHLEPDFDLEALEVGFAPNGFPTLSLDLCPDCERVSRSVRERRYIASRHPNPLLNLHFGCADCYEAANREMTENLRNP